MKKYLVLVLGFVLLMGEAAVSSSLTASPQGILNAAKRTLMWAKTEEAKEGKGVEAQYGITRTSENLSKSYIDLMYAIVAADGELGEPEEMYIKKLFKDYHLEELLDPEAVERILQYERDVAEKARKGCFKNIDLAPLVGKQVLNARELGIEGDLERAVAVGVLCDTITAARADGYAPEERRAAQKVADKFRLSPRLFSLINQYARLESLLDQYPSLEADEFFKGDALKLLKETKSLIPSSQEKL